MRDWAPGLQPGQKVFSPPDVVRAQSSYLALLFASQVGDGPLVRTRVAAGRGAANQVEPGALFGYAIRTKGGLDLVIVNMDDPATAGRRAVSLQGLQNFKTSQASQLYGPGLADTNAGKLIPLSPATQLGSTITVNPGSATLIRFGRR